VQLYIGRKEAAHTERLRRDDVDDGDDDDGGVEVNDYSSDDQKDEPDIDAMQLLNGLG